MGISQYLQWLKNKYDDIFLSSDSVFELLDDINLYIDANGLLYGSKERVLSGLKNKHTESELESMITTQVINDIARLVNEFEYKDNVRRLNVKRLVVTFDGLAPMAKIQQQRQRRYRTQHSESKDKPQYYNTIQFTAGTTTVNRITNAVKEALLKDVTRFPEEIIFSSELNRGEGEQKIFNYISSQEDDRVNVIHGLDNDLFMLSLLMTKKIYLYKEGFDKPFVDMGLARKSIKNDLYSEEKHKKNSNLYLHDFIVMSLFLGNDFIPKAPSLSNRRQAGNLLYDIYKDIDEPLCKIASVKEGKKTITRVEMNPEGIKLFLYSLAHREPDMLKDLSYTRNISDKTFEPIDELKGLSSYNKYKLFNMFRTRWYKTVFGKKVHLRDDSIIKEIIPDWVDFESHPQDMVEQYMKILTWTHRYYIDGNDAIDWNYFYPYWFAPLFRDIYDSYGRNYKIDLSKQVPPLETEAKRELSNENPKPRAKKLDEEITINYDAISYKDPKYNLSHQLLAVIPPESFKYVPLALQDMKDFMSPLFDLYPVLFKEWYGGGGAESSIPLIPMANMKRIIDAVKSVKNLDLWNAETEDDTIIEEGVRQRIIVPDKKKVIKPDYNVKLKNENVSRGTSNPRDSKKVFTKSETVGLEAERNNPKRRNDEKVKESKPAEDVDIPSDITKAILERMRKEREEEESEKSTSKPAKKQPYVRRGRKYPPGGRPYVERG